MLAQGKSAGLITRRSSDRNRDMLSNSKIFWIFFLGFLARHSLGIGLGFFLLFFFSCFCSFPELSYILSFIKMGRKPHFRPNSAWGMAHYRIILTL